MTVRRRSASIRCSIGRLSRVLTCASMRSRRTPTTMLSRFTSVRGCRSPSSGAIPWAGAGPESFPGRSCSGPSRCRSGCRGSIPITRRSSSTTRRGRRLTRGSTCWTKMATATRISWRACRSGSAGSSDTSARTRARRTTPRRYATTMTSRRRSRTSTGRP